MTKREREILIASVSWTDKTLTVNEEKAFQAGARWADKTMIDKACKCYCDDICDKGRCGMCFYKHDNEGQVKNTFRYNECNELKLIRKAMEGQYEDVDSKRCR